MVEPVSLAPERDAEDTDGHTVSLGREPWLHVDTLAIPRLAGRFVEIAYRSSFWDEPARPVFRFWRGAAFVDRIGAGPIGGRANWVGRVPVHTDRISVSPTNRPGRFDFAIESIRVRHWPSLLAAGLRWNPRPTRSAILTRLIGWAPESDVNLAWATGSIPLSGYEVWRKTHERPLDLVGLDRPRCNWAELPPIRLVIVNADDQAAVRRTVASIKAQIFPSWHATRVGVQESDDPQVNTLPIDEIERSLACDPAGTLTGVLAAGDRLHPLTLAIVAERAQRDPASVVYGDELHRRDDNTRRPDLKPGWSPRLQAGRPYLRRGLFVRDLTPEGLRCLISGDDLPAALKSRGMTPLHRLIVETPQLETPKPVAETPARADLPCTDQRAAIIIPTRNHPALLRRVLASIRARSRPGSFEILVIDNASTDPAAIAHLDELRTDPLAGTALRVLDHPDPFNFSRICNEGAARTDANVLVFLNDDTEVLSDGWLDRMMAHALEPGVGAVGARLTFPDGRLQHVGVLVGMGESAGHFGAPAPGDDPGWAGRNTVTHEVSAVTGACLVVARDKFEAVGGFDAEHLPIELSDIDLCLKLNARGWQTIVDPAVHLMHEESASRGGATLRRLTVHDRERAIFIERWRHVLRDDPLFHPGLSLYNWQAALG